jgi:hypothetical protein
MGHTCNPSYWTRQKSGGSWCKTSLMGNKNLQDSISTNKLGVVTQAHNSIYMGSMTRTVVWASPGKYAKPYSKNN